ncbi:MAG TPA: recombinase family protein, partial [Anaerolineae bacterium]|nr:recombinase family protein [Anaerolineae bacterium]
MSKRAVSIARVSTKEQADNGYSLSSQLEACQLYAERHGFALIGEFQDDISGITPIADRPEGRKVQALIDARAVDAVIVYQVDRLFRDNVELLITTRQWLQAGIELHFCDIGQVRSENDVLLLIRGWQGCDERAKILERFMRGKRTKAASGKVVAVGRPAYGYDYLRDEEGHVVNFKVNEEQAAVVRLIFQWYTEGEENSGPLALYAIAKRLSMAGIPAPSHTNRKRERHVWNSVGVARIIKSTTYRCKGLSSPQNYAKISVS